MRLRERWVRACALAVLMLSSSVAWAQTAQPTRTPATAATAAAAAERFSKGAPFPAWVDPVRELPSTQTRAPAVILVADTQFHAAATPAVHVHRAVQVNSHGAIDSVGTFTLEFNPAYEHLDLHVLRIIRDGTALDRLAAATPAFLQRETQLDRSIYTGEVSASFVINDVRMGDVVEYAYTRRGQNPVLGGKFVDSASFDRDLPTELRRVSLLKPRERDIRWRMVSNDPGQALQPVTSERDGMTRLLWEARALPRVEVDRDVPSHYRPYREIHFSEFATWGEVAVWAADLFKLEAQASPELDAVAATINGKATEDERASAALQWVQAQIRYFSLALGESTHRPAAPSVTLTRRFGDCKDKTALLIALLDRVGIPAQPVLVSARHVRGLQSLPPSPYAFDHAIVLARIDGKPYYLDPTRVGQVGRVAAMGQRWEGAEVLVAAPQTQELTTVVAHGKPTHPTDELHEHIRLPRFGGAGTIDVRRTWSGLRAEGIRQFKNEASNERLARYLLGPYEKRYPGFKLEGNPELQDDKQGNNVVAVFRLTVPGLARETAQRWEVPYEASNVEDLLELPDSSWRRQPLALPTNVSARYAVLIDFPPDVAVMNDPRHVQLANAEVHAVARDLFRGNRAVLEIKLDVPGFEIQPRNLAEYARTVRRLNGIQRGVYFVTKASLQPKGSVTQPSLTMRQSMEKRAHDTLDRLKKSIESGRLGPDERANAHAQRAELLMHLQQMDLAWAEIAMAMQSGPHLPNPLAARGRYHALQGRYAEALADLDQVVILHPSVESYARRGSTLYFAGKLEQAAVDFERTANDDRNTALSYGQLWHAFTMARLGRPLNARFAKAALEDPKGVWPRPMLGLMHGAISPDELLEIAGSKTGLDRETALAEAYFTIAQWHLARGDQALAIDFLRKTIELGAIAYVEHQGALMQLATMGAAVEPASGDTRK